jgi:hypothetical protein
VTIRRRLQLHERRAARPTKSLSRRGCPRRREGLGLKCLRVSEASGTMIENLGNAVLGNGNTPEDHLTHAQNGPRHRLGHLESRRTIRSWSGRAGQRLERRTAVCA